MHWPSKRELLMKLHHRVDRINDKLDAVLAASLRTEALMTAAKDYIEAALASLDVQMTNLQIRLTQDAEALAQALANAQIAAEDEAALVAAADRIQATAVLVNTLAQPTAVADPDDPAEADPLDSDGDGTPDEPAPEEPPVENPPAS